MRQLKRTVKIGNITIGGTNPIAVQTMLNVPVKDIAGNVEQAKRVAKAGCQIVRVTVPTPADAAVVSAIKEAVDIPVVADIHFDYRAALAAIDAGADKIRINPGNIGDDDRVKAVADACNAKNIPIRIGVNGGSLEKHILARYGAPVPEAMVESAMYHVRLLEKHDFNNIVISIKSSNVPRMMAAYRLLASQTDYPLHVGVTEAGGNRMGLIKSGMGIGGLLLEGIGDTLRVSLTGDPEDEVYAGYDILRAVGYAVAGPEIISCPTCGRTQYPMIEIANEVERRLKEEGFKKPVKIAIMGCIVNGPGEASDADIGIAGGKDCAVLFEHGEKIRTLKGDIVRQFVEEIHKLSWFGTPPKTQNRPLKPSSRRLCGGCFALARCCWCALWSVLCWKSGTAKVLPTPQSSWPPAWCWMPLPFCCLAWWPPSPRCMSSAKIKTSSENKSEKRCQSDENVA